MVTKTDPNAKPRERLTRERVIDAALRVMDSEGLEAVSMRRVAREVGVEAMSLYNHVRDKEDLLAGIQQRVFSEFAFDADPGDPYGNGVRVAHAWRDLMRTHPALIEIMAEKHQAPISIEALRPMEKALEVLRSMGVPDPDVMQVFHAFGGYIQGFVMMEGGTIESPENMNGKHAEASNASAVTSLLRKMRSRPVRTLVAVTNSLMGEPPSRSKSTLSSRISCSGFNPDGFMS